MRASPFRGREQTAVDIDVCPERRSLRYHQTCLALESVEESTRAETAGLCFFFGSLLCFVPLPRAASVLTVSQTVENLLVKGLGVGGGAGDIGVTGSLVGAG